MRASCSRPKALVSYVVRNGSRVNTLNDKGVAATPFSTGLPFRSTVGAFEAALALSAPGKYRKIPFRACWVSTVPVTFSLCCTRWPSKNPKKNVLFLTIGPPRRAPYSFRLEKFFATPLKLLNQVLAFSAELLFVQKALPWNRLVPERVAICT